MIPHSPASNNVLCPPWTLRLLLNCQVRVDGGAAHGSWHFNSTPPMLCICFDFHSRQNAAVEHQFTQIENTECYWLMQVGGAVCSSAILLPRFEAGEPHTAVSQTTPICHTYATRQLCCRLKMQHKSTSTLKSSKKLSHCNHSAEERHRETDCSCVLPVSTHAERVLSSALVNT